MTEIASSDGKSRRTTSISTSAEPSVELKRAAQARFFDSARRNEDEALDPFRLEECEFDCRHAEVADREKRRAVAIPFRR